MKKVLNVGQCGPDHAAICLLIQKHFQAEVIPADDGPAALARLRADAFDLVLINRKLDIDYSDGMEVLRSIKADPELASTPVMLVTNYPEHQEAAVAAGAVPGFGKQQFHEPATLSRLAEHLS